MGDLLMTRRQSEQRPATRLIREQSADADPGHALRTTLREQVRRRLSGGARGLEIQVCHDSTTVVLAGVLSSFYAKQLVYELCRRFTPGFRVIDSTVVGRLPTPRGSG
ncbi:MAG TPA: hypothetical protein VHY91_19875 [Pirellulales bacterium]|jgi:hypothetical protein|nr:hypothetical protein [Pirellulales bacterium]